MATGRPEGWACRIQGAGERSQARGARLGNHTTGQERTRCPIAAHHRVRRKGRVEMGAPAPRCAATRARRDSQRGDTTGHQGLQRCARKGAHAHTKDAQPPKVSTYSVHIFCACLGWGVKRGVSFAHLWVCDLYRFHALAPKVRKTVSVLTLAHLGVRDSYSRPEKAAMPCPNSRTAAGMARKCCAGPPRPTGTSQDRRDGQEQFP